MDQVEDVEVQREQEDAAYAAGTLTDPKAIRRAKTRAQTAARQLAEIEREMAAQEERVAQEKKARIEKMNEAKAAKANAARFEKKRVVAEMLDTLASLVGREEITVGEAFALIEYLHVHGEAKYTESAAFLSGVATSVKHDLRLLLDNVERTEQWEATKRRQAREQEERY